jgi:hypothetical protein
VRRHTNDVQSSFGKDLMTASSGVSLRSSGVKQR